MPFTKMETTSLLIRIIISMVSMITRTKWVDRKFNFDFEEGMLPAIVGRLQGTPARLEDLVAGFPAGILTKKLGDSWTIQEQVGHLIDLEPLHVGRLADFLEDAERLRAADMSNQKTNEAQHNDTPIDKLLTDGCSRTFFRTWTERSAAWPSRFRCPTAPWSTCRCSPESR